MEKLDLFQVCNLDSMRIKCDRGSGRNCRQDGQGRFHSYKKWFSMLAPAKLHQYRESKSSPLKFFLGESRKAPGNAYLYKAPQVVLIAASFLQLNFC